MEKEDVEMEDLDKKEKQKKVAKEVSEAKSEAPKPMEQENI